MFVALATVFAACATVFVALAAVLFVTLATRSGAIIYWCSRRIAHNTKSI